MWKRKRNARRRNARPRPAFTAGPLSSPRTDHAYKKYMLRHSALHGVWYIEKGGHHIGQASSLREAYQIVDILAGDAPVPASSFRGLNPKGTRVSRCVRKLKRSGRVASPWAVCQHATHQSYATGRKLNKGMRLNPLPYAVSFRTGPAFATFRSLPRATQYARALAKHANRSVRVMG